jgi:hypothetical protein
MHGGREVAYLDSDMRTSPKTPTSGEPQRAYHGAHRWNQRNSRKRRSVSDWETPYPWLHSARTWSPAVAPPVLGLILVFVASLPTPPPSRAGASTSTALPLLFLLYFLCGVAYGLCLFFARSLNSWAKILLGGSVLYSLAVLWFLGGPVPVVFGLIFFGGAGIYYVHSCRHDVPSDTLHITTLLGRYWRTIPPGRALLLPGERVHSEVANPAKQYTTPLVQVHLADAPGNRYIAQASAIAGYCYSPTDALSKRVMHEKWEDDLYKSIRDTLRDVLAVSGHAALEATQPGQPSGRRDGSGRHIEGQELAQALLDQLRAYVSSRGIAVGWVRIRDLQLSPDPRFSSTANVEQETKVVLPPLGPGSRRRNSGVDSSDESDEQDEEDEETLPVEALLDLYDTVRVNNITDPETIRSIAEAFRSLGLDQGRSASSPYDANEVAKLLFQYASSLEQR